MEKQSDSLDRLIDRALAVYANSEPPLGLEERILANIALRKARSQQRTMRIAGLALTAILIGTAVYEPVDPARTEVREVPAVTTIVEPARAPVAEIVEPLELVVEVAPAESTEVLIEEESFIADLEVELEENEEESLLSDFELEPLTIAALDLPALTR